MLRSRLCDLLWICRDQPRPDLMARAAIRAYLDLGGVWDGFLGMECVKRAIDLARALGDGSLTREAYAFAESNFRELVRSPEKPGATLGYLRVLAMAPNNFQSPDLAAHITAASQTFDQEVHRTG